VHVRELVEVDLLCLVGHDPGPAGKIRDGDIAHDVIAPFKLTVQNSVDPERLLFVSIDGVGNLFGRVELEMPCLSEHRAHRACLPRQPGHEVEPASLVGWQKLPGFFRQIPQDGRGLEDGKRLTAAGWLMIHDRRDAVVGVDLLVIRVELLPLGDVDRLQTVVEPHFLQRDGQLPTVWRGPEIGVNHGVRSGLGRCSMTCVNR